MFKIVFNSFTSVNIFYTPLGHITHKASKKISLKFNAKIDGESMLRTDDILGPLLNRKLT